MKNIYTRYALLIIICVAACQDAQAQINVPNLVGRKLTDARVILRQRKLNMVAPQERTTESEPGTVIYQHPNAGEQVSEGATVYLTVATTMEMVGVPNVVDSTLEEAGVLLLKSQLQLEATEDSTTDKVPGTVLSQSPVFGDSVVVGTSVSLVVATAKKRVKVPNLVGKTLAEARVILRATTLSMVAPQMTRAEFQSGIVFEQLPAAGIQVVAGTPVYLSSMRSVEVPKLVGRTLTEARLILHEIKLNMVAPQKRKIEFEPGTVFEQYPAAQTQVPEGTSVYLNVATTMEMVEVPNLVDSTLEEASVILFGAGLQLEVLRDSITDRAPGTVLGQTPLAGDSVYKGASVRLVVATTTKLVDVPNLVGVSLAKASTDLQKVGLQMVRIRLQMPEQQETISGYKPNTVFEQRPTPGIQVPLGSPLYLKVTPVVQSFVIVPNVVGATVEEAENVLGKAQLRLVSTERTFTREYKPNTIFEQTPAAGKRVSAGGTVYVKLAVPEEMVRVPNLLGHTVDQAREFLTDSRLRLGSTEMAKTTGQDSGTVIWQSIGAWTQVPVGTPISLKVASAMSVVDGSPLLEDPYLILIVLTILLALILGYAFLQGQWSKNLPSGIQIRPTTHSGIQQIRSVGALALNVEVRVKANSDPGTQEIKVKGDIVRSERRNNA